MQRLYLPSAGQIFIDGTDIAHTDPQWLRRQVGVVLQETLLFSGTLRENIALAVPDASQQQVMAAAALAGAHEFISELRWAMTHRLANTGNFPAGRNNVSALPAP
jgi:subfamily B ATP-binding cassette protein HlyB/CyaB